MYMAHCLCICSQDAREKFKAITDEAFRILNGIKKSREKSIAKARPYFELRKRARRVSDEDEVVHLFLDYFDMVVMCAGQV